MNSKKTPLMSEEIYQRQSEICGALSHPIRLKIIDLLQEGELSCSEMLNFIEIPKASLSQHLNVLKNAKLIDFEKRGLYQFYYLLLPEIKGACHILREVLVGQVNLNKEDNKQLAKDLNRLTK